MTATIAVIVAVPEKKKKTFSDRSDHSDLMETTFQRSLRTLESGFHKIAMIAAIADFFFLSATAAITAIVAITWKPGLREDNKTSADASVHE